MLDTQTSAQFPQTYGPFKSPVARWMARILLRRSFPIVARDTSNYFFTGGRFSNQTVLLAWESGHIRPFINALLASYGGADLPSLPTSGTPQGDWPSADYDTMWSISLDARGNLTVDNALCEGIDSTKLPTTAPQF